MSAQDLHKQSEEAREKGDFLKALQLADEALIGYQKEGSVVKFSEILCSRALTFRHLFESTADRNYVKVAKFEVKAAIKILEMNNIQDGMAIALYTLAKVYGSLGKFEKEKETIQEAITRADNDQSFTTEMKTRLAAVEYQLGDESAIERFDQALDELRQNPHPEEYVQNVWLSGAYIHIAEACMIREEKEKADGFIEEAESIIGNNEQYRLRIAQILKLKEKLR